MPAGSSRAVRLDPLALPVRFAAIDAAADERMRCPLHDVDIIGESAAMSRLCRTEQGPLGCRLLRGVVAAWE